MEVTVDLIVGLKFMYIIEILCGGMPFFKILFGYLVCWPYSLMSKWVPLYCTWVDKSNKICRWQWAVWYQG